MARCANQHGALRQPAWRAALTSMARCANQHGALR
jgi:hypothetical protein